MVRRPPIISSPPRALNADSNTANHASDAFDFTNIDPQVTPIDLAELKVWPPRQGERDQTFPIWPDLRIAEETITTKSWRIAVHLLRAELAAEFNGCNVAPGTRYGDTPLPPTVEMTETEVGEKDISRTDKLSAGLGAGLGSGISASGKIGVSRKANVRIRTDVRRKSQVFQQRVATLPNDRWEIIEPRGGRLRGPFLVVPAADKPTEMPLCRVIADSETAVITLSLEVRPGDLDTDITPLEGAGWFAWTQEERPNKSKIAKLLVTKACTERFGRSGDERITLARTILQGKRRSRTED